MFFISFFFVSRFTYKKTQKYIFSFFTLRKISYSRAHNGSHPFLPLANPAFPIKLGTKRLRFLWRHQNGMWKYGFLIGPFFKYSILIGQPIYRPILLLAVYLEQHCLQPEKWLKVLLWVDANTPTVFHRRQFLIIICDLWYWSWVF